MSKLRTSIVVAALAVVLFWLALGPGDRTTPLRSEAPAVATPVVRTGTNVPPLSPLALEEDGARERHSFVEASTPAAESATAPLRFHGRIVDEGRAPVEGAEITIRRKDGDTWDTVLGRSKSDAEGYFVVLVSEDEDIEGDLRCQAMPRQHVATAVDPVFPETEIVLKTRRATTLHGTVVDALTGEPVEGAQLTDNHLTTVTTDEVGHFAFRRRPVGGSLEIAVAKEGYVLLESRVFVDGLLPEPVLFELERGLHIPCEIRDAWTGIPLAGARVLDGRNVVPLTESDELGAFSIHVFETDSREIWIHAEGYPHIVWSRDGFDGITDRPLVFSVPPLAWVEGRVSDRKGEPLAEGFEARVRCRASHSYHPMTGGPTGSYLHLPRGLRATVTGNEFRLPVVPCALPHTLRVVADGYSEFTRGLGTLTHGENHRVEVVLDLDRGDR